ncbi:phosphatase PAP2 family protein [Neorhizobium sp. NPDC001467]|uniref:phosphatase PAP2 family protein n=1 Tax=Neorhizobium sp. NPDC001467 TaxID=3390595 RepID=UPI003D076B4C
MTSTFSKLRQRRQRHGKDHISPRWWPYALVAINLILIAFFILDAPMGAYATHTPNLLYPIGEKVTDFARSGWILVVAGLLFLGAFAYLRRPMPHRRRFQVIYTTHLAAYVFIAVAVSSLITNILKVVLGRARPTQYEEWGTLGFSPFRGDFHFESFPSGHSTVAGALMAALALLAPRYRVFFLIAGLWLGMARVIIGVHYPSDVVAGLAFGAWAAFVTAIAFSRYGLLFRFTPGRLPRPRRPFRLRTRPLSETV